MTELETKALEIFYKQGHARYEDIAAALEISLKEAAELSEALYRKGKIVKVDMS